MTPQILQSDIELARKLLDESRSETEVIAMLLRRGIPQEQASQLVDALRTGKPVEAKPVSMTERKTVTRQSAPERAGRFRRRRSHQSHRSRAARRAERNVILALALLCLLVIAAIALWQGPPWKQREAPKAPLSKSAK